MTITTKDDLFWAAEFDKTINEMKWQKIYLALSPMIEKWKKESNKMSEHEHNYSCDTTGFTFKTKDIIETQKNIIKQLNDQVSKLDAELSCIKMKYHKLIKDLIESLVD